MGIVGKVSLDGLVRQRLTRRREGRRFPLPFLIRQPGAVALQDRESQGCVPKTRISRSSICVETRKPRRSKSSFTCSVLAARRYLPSCWFGKGLCRWEVPSHRRLGHCRYRSLSFCTDSSRYSCLARPFSEGRSPALAKFILDALDRRIDQQPHSIRSGWRRYRACAPCYHHGIPWRQQRPA